MMELEKNLFDFGKQIGRKLEIKGKVRGPVVARRIGESLGNLRNAYGFLSAQGEENLPKATEWFLDNWYLAQRQGKEAVLHLRQRKTLRQAGGKAFLLEVSYALVKEQKGKIDPQVIYAYFSGLQEEIPLQEEEISLLISLLSAGLVYYLDDLTEELTTNTRDDLAEEMEHVFSSLRLLTGLDMLNLLDEISLTEKFLRQDPAGIYTQMDETSRQRYRSRVLKLAKKEGIAEHEMAKTLITLSQERTGKQGHVGYYLFVKPLGKAVKNRRQGIYMGGMLITTLFLAFAIGAALESIFVSFLLLIPISEIVKNVFDFLVIKFVSPRHVPRLALQGGVPKQGKSLCVISMLLDSEKSGREHVTRLEEYFLANRDGGEHLLFGILADFPEAKEKQQKKEEKWLGATKKALGHLQEKYQQDFYLFYRESEKNPKTNRYMAPERKRGALLELARFLEGKSKKLQVAFGKQEALKETVYVITLDSDTRLNVGSATEMIGAMLHPLHAPVVDEKRGVVIEGNALMQPRIAVDLQAATKSNFSRIFAGLGGVDPYGSLSSDVYQDLFGEASFAGKGIFHVKAFLSCLDGAFPENWVLSHDLLEGAYLKTAYLGDVELTDGYPYKTLSYFSRSHRWLRGDFQLLPWLFPKVKRENGVYQKNPLSLLNRYKIFDNLRRALVPVCIMLALAVSMFVSLHSLFWAGFVAVVTALSNLLLSWAQLLFRKDSGRKQRYHASIVTGFSGAFLQTVSQLILLPYQAYVHVSAIVTALWRMGVSKNNMLSWVVSSKNEQQTKGGLVHHYRKMLPAVLLGVFAILFSGSFLKVFVGIVWTLSPIYAMWLSKVRLIKEELTQEEKGYLQGAAGDILSYFSDFLTEEDNYLPPDNWQEVPAVGIAHRTSPTNIGLGLLTVLGAVDLKLCTKEVAVEKVEKMLNTIDRMEKWEGHLYNWYDTRTLAPLYPRYVSAVDNGNLSGYLLIAREMLNEMGEELLAKRMGSLYENMAYDKLYHPQRKLFHIGYDLEKGELTEGFYDLLASEARQLSYIAVAKGDVEPRHWRRLGRALVEQKGYYGLVSWTGSMFEYLMPNLIMPVYKDSLLYESSRFCVYAQKRKGMPWGISESAYYALDPSQSYSYKAHGVNALALKRGMDKEKVIAPYASFLALPVDKKGAIANLKHLETLGAKGKYGFYEALDYTEGRRGSGDFSLVKTYMAHHLGMSFLAIHGVLTQGKMAKRFMQDRAMAAFKELLQEKVPVGQVVLESVHHPVPQKPKRGTKETWTMSREGFSVAKPKVGLLSSGVYSVMVTDTGHSRSMSEDNLMTRFEEKRDGPPQGMGFYFQTKGELHSLQAAPQYDKERSYQTQFSENSICLQTTGEDFTSQIEISLAQQAKGEIRQVRLKNTTEEKQEGYLILYTEPVLLPGADYFAHPAFAKLSIETSLVENSILVKRRGNGKREESFLAFAVSQKFVFDTKREQAIGRSGFYAAMGKVSKGTKGTVLDPCVCIKVPLSLVPGEEKQVDFAMVFGQGEEVVKQAQALLQNPAVEGGSYMENSIYALGEKKEDWVGALNLAGKLLYPYTTGKSRGKYVREDSLGGRDLWPWGISGDLPLVTLVVGEEDEKEIERQLKRHSFLGKCSVAYDLVFLLADGGDYRRPAFTALDETLAKMGLTHEKGGRGGIHLLENKGDMSAIYALSVEVYEKGEQKVQEETLEIKPRFKGAHQIVGEDPVFSYTEKGEVKIQMVGKLPPNTWSHMLTGGEFGFIATESGTGHMWQTNARENQITPWENDTLTHQGVEQLSLLTKAGEEISLFAQGDEHPTTVTYGFGYAIWEKEIQGRKIKTTAFVPEGTNARVFLLEGNFQEGDFLDYYAKLKLGESEKNRFYVTTGEVEGVLWAKNPANVEFPHSKVTLFAKQKPVGYTTNHLSYAQRSLDKQVGAGQEPCFYVRYPAEDKMVLVLGTIDTGHIKRLANYEFIKQELERTKDWWQEQVGQIQVETGIENLDRLLSGWALYQSLACRILGRSSVYQSGGAYGFRDQLQDSTAILAVKPQVTKKMLLEAAAHQFEEGDVMHWWHPTGIENSVAKGVRTGCSDDLLFLPYVLCEYVEKTGDVSICMEEVAYITSPPLEEWEHERYEAPKESPLEESLFLHGKRAIDLVLARGVGQHDLCLMGTGDWNDGMNLVGAQGKGESVWLTWFFSHVLERFANLCYRLEKTKEAQAYKKLAEKYGRAADSAWDGKWYMRGYYDNGSTLGSHKDEECQIDAIAQGWSAMCPYSEPRRVKEAIEEAAKRLFDKENKLVQLFDPPFDKGAENPGYIRGYAPGLRENGGQYTHGVLWLSMGAFGAGLNDLGFSMLRAMLPGERDQGVYRGEPYVLAADVYANPQHKGRSGWTWYTGASAWYFRVAMEELLGLKLRDGKLFVEPNLPKALESYRVRWKGQEIVVSKGEIQVNGRPYDGKGIALFQEEKEILSKNGKI